MLRLSTSAGPLGLAGSQHADGAAHRVGGAASRRVSSSSSSSSKSRSASALSAGSTGDGDLVAADVDVAGERLFDEPQQLVPGAEQAHHRLGTRDDDLGLGAAGALAGRCRGHGSGRPCFLWTGTWCGSAYPGGHPNSGLRGGGRARAATDWPASAPVLKTSRQPEPATPSSPATAAAARCTATSASGSSAASAPTSGVVRPRDHQHVRRGLRVDVPEGDGAARPRGPRSPGSPRRPSGRTGSRPRPGSYGCGGKPSGRARVLQS